MSPKSPPLAIAIILIPFMYVISTALAPCDGNCWTGWLENLNVIKYESLSNSSLFFSHKLKFNCNCKNPSV